MHCTILHFRHLRRFQLGDSGHRQLKNPEPWMVNVQKQLPVEGEQQSGNMFDSSITATNLGLVIFR